VPDLRVAMFASEQPIPDLAADAIDARGELVVRWTDRGTRFEEEPGLGARPSRAIATRR
jgi:hypothetical protein